MVKWLQVTLKRFEKAKRGIQLREKRTTLKRLTVVGGIAAGLPLFPRKARGESKVFEAEVIQDNAIGNLESRKEFQFLVFVEECKF